MNDVLVYAIKRILNFKTMTFIGIYILFGALVFANMNTGQNYIYIYTVILTSKNFFLVFILPPALLLIVRCYNFMYSNKFIVLRFTNRKKLGQNLLKLTTFVIIYYYITILLCVGISSNIILHSDNITRSLGYYVSDEKVLLLYGIKTFLNLYLISFLALILIYKFQDIKTVFCIIIGVVLIINLGNSVIINTSLFDFSKYLVQLGYTKELLKDISDSAIMYFILFMLLSILYYKLSIKIKTISAVDDI